MVEWQPADTNTHQDHVIAHVIGATVLAYFIWDETAYLLLDIGFIWNIYLDGEMGLVPQTVAASELEVNDEIKSEIRSDLDQISLSDETPLLRLSRSTGSSPIVSVEFLAFENLRQVRIHCEDGILAVETSLETAQIKITEDWQG